MILFGNYRFGELTYGTYTFYHHFTVKINHSWIGTYTLYDSFIRPVDPKICFFVWEKSASQWAGAQ